MGDPLTQRQHRVLVTIERFVRDEGYTPSVREVGSIVGLAPATVQQHLDALERKGYIRRSGQSHGIEILDNGADAGVVHVPIVGEIAAGLPIDAFEERIDTVPVASGLVPSSDTYALRVRGDSMIDDHICDGDLVIVAPADDRPGRPDRRGHAGGRQRNAQTPLPRKRTGALAAGQRRLRAHLRPRRTRARPRRRHPAQPLDQANTSCRPTAGSGVVLT